MIVNDTGIHVQLNHWLEKAQKCVRSSDLDIVGYWSINRINKQKRV